MKLNNNNVNNNNCSIYETVLINESVLIYFLYYVFFSFQDSLMNIKFKMS